MINWGALGLVGLVSLAAGVAVVVLVSFALVGLSAREPVHDGSAVSSDGAEPVGLATTSPMSPAAGTALAAICLLATVAIVVYGLSLIIFHH